MLNLILLILFVACLAMLYGDGIWSNALRLLNVLLAGLMATSLFEPVADALESMLPTYTYLWDFLSLWLVFVIAFSLFRFATDWLSDTAVRFKRPVDLAGGSLLAIWIACVMIGFTTMTLHTAPLPRNFLGGAFQPTPDARMFFGTAPDRKWLAFVQMTSRGSLSTAANDDKTGEEGMNVFDPQSDFILRYAQRRQNFSQTPNIRVYRNVD